MSDVTANERSKQPGDWLKRMPKVDPSAEPVASVPAATVVLLRDGEPGLEALMLRRNSKLEFAGGMWVFPGGRVDAGDIPESGDVLEGARRAAVREAFEEAALAVDGAALVPFAHWEPPPVAPKRFATWFFMGRAPEGAVTVDGGEIHDHRWAAPAAALAARDAGEIELAPPTWVTLHRLAAHADVASALADAEATEPEFFVTHIARVGEGAIAALWHGDAGYESGDGDAAGPRHRLLMLDSGWVYERWE
jgi:8-oxo-dGTP pyrophosphatase MutT (NUDIX family)